MLPVMLPVDSMPLIVKFPGSQKVIYGFLTARGFSVSSLAVKNDQPVLKGQLY